MRKTLLIMLAVLMVACVFVSCKEEPKTAVITFKPGDAAGEAYTQAIVCGAETELKRNRFENLGFTFIGWTNTPDGNPIYEDMDTVRLFADTTLYAVWSEDYGIVTKSVTGGKLVPQVTSYIISEEKQIVSLTPTPDKGFYYAGVKMDGSENESAFTLLYSLIIPAESTGDILLTPVFRENSNPAIITFNPGDTTGVSYTQEVECGQQVKLDPNEFSKEGYRFMGWSMSPTGGLDYLDEDTVKIDMDINLYAIWSKLYEITVVGAEGGTLVPKVSEYVVSDSRQIIPLTITPAENHIFKSVKLDGSENEKAFYLALMLIIPEESTGKIVITPEFRDKPSSLEYVDAIWEDSQVKTETKTLTSDKYALVSKNGTNWNGGWRVVAEDIEMDGRITVSGETNLIICDGVTLKAAKGINVSEGATLTIYGQTKQTGKLIINEVENGFAGIGGSAEANCGVIAIKGTTIETYGGDGGAAIGGGEKHLGGTITIYNGTVKAYGGNNGAGIGTGNMEQAETAEGANITVYGGEVHAEGNNNGAGIGGGNKGKGGTIVLAGGNVYGRGGMSSMNGGAGIGGGHGGEGGNITISGGHVEGYGGDFSAGIGSGNRGVYGGVVLISGGYVKAEGNRGAAGIGGGYMSDGADVTITGGEIEIKGGEGNIDMDYYVHNVAVGKGVFRSDEGKNRSLKLGEGVELEAQGYDDGDKWKDWKEGDSRKFRLRTKK